MKRLYFILSVLMVASMILTACGGTAAAPAVCKSDAAGCAVFSAGQTVKIGMGAPMTGDNASFGKDISDAAMLAVSDAGKFKGFAFELVAQDDGGNAEGGAAVANNWLPTASCRPSPAIFSPAQPRLPCLSTKLPVSR